MPEYESELNVFDAYYLTFITVTTIGYGDSVPKK